MGELRGLQTTLEKYGPAGAFVFDDEQVAVLGEGAKVFPVLVAMSGATFPLRLSRMGGLNLVGLRREVRDAAGLSIGDVVTIDISLDRQERTVDVPADVTDALAADTVAGKAFAALAYSHRKEFVRWIEEAKRDQTRRDRIVKMVDMVKRGQRR